MIKLSNKARASIFLKDFGARRVNDFTTGHCEIERTIGICANIAGEDMHIWSIETLGM